MIEWTNGIPKGTSIDSVKKTQPTFIEIDWNHPETNDGETRYSIKKVKNSNDILKLGNYLSFIGNKYQGRFAYK